MKKHVLYIALVASLLVGCREKGDIYLNPSDPINMHYTTYAEQFDLIWRGINTYYVFWSEDSTKWDDVYKNLMPKFKELDEAYKADGTIPDSLKVATLYEEATSTLIDHHMQIKLKDVHSGITYTCIPGMEEVRHREYAAGQDYSVGAMQNAINDFIAKGLLDAGQWAEVGDQKNFFGIRTLDDGRRIAYLWQNSYYMNEALNLSSPSDEQKVYINNIEAWLDMCLKETKLAGIILDNRCNTGGKVKDLEIVVAPFLKEPLHYADVRYKEGPGRYEYTEWIPAYVDTGLIKSHRDLEAENIPYVVLTNAHSISMAEISSQVIKKLPTGCMIGERTFGAHGQSLPYSTYFHDGAFGDPNGLHYVFTSNMQTRFVDDGVLEGKGITPDKPMLQIEDGYIGAMTKAIDYIKAY